MTIQGAINELFDLIHAEDIPVYYKGSIQKVIETIVMEFEDRKTENCSEKPNNCANCKHLKKHNGNLADWVCDRKGSIVTNPYDKECDEMWERKDEPQSIIGESFPSYITEDRTTQVLDGWQVYHRTSTTAVEDEPQTDCAWK